MIERGKLAPPDDSYLGELKAAMESAADRIRAASNEGVVGNSPSDASLDASLLMLSILRFPDREICEKTTAAIRDELSAKSTSAPEHNYLLFRYRRTDDFGAPEDPFIICSFWLVQAIAQLGDQQKGAEMLQSLKKSANSLGLYAEHFSPQSLRQLGNFPQAYSHVGLVNAAFAVSPKWTEIL